MEKAKELGFQVTQYEDDKKKLHIVVGDLRVPKTPVEVQIPEDNIFVFFKADEKGPLFALLVENGCELVSLLAGYPAFRGRLTNTNTFSITCIVAC